MRRLKTLRRPPIYPKSPGHLPCSSLTHPLPLPSRRPSVSFGGFGLTGHPINIPKTYIDNLNLVVIQSMVRLPNGKDGRRIISVNEIVGYDSATDSFSYIEVFRWNPVDDSFEFTGYMNSYLLEEVIAFKLGLPPQRKREIYKELTRRANILRKLKDQGVTGFYELFKVISQASRQGVF